MVLSKKNRGLLAGIVLTLSLGAMVGCSSKGDKDVAYTNIDAVKMEKMAEDSKKTLIIDVRDRKAYDKGHLDQAISIPYDEFESRLDELKGYENQKVILICNTGNKSSKLSALLTEKGFKDVYNAEDGMEEHKYKTVTYENLTGAQVEKMMSEDKNLVLIEARGEKEFNKGHLKGAINIPVDELESRLSEIDKDKTVVYYCGSGAKSGKAADILVKNGYKAYNAADGLGDYDYKLVTK